MAVQRNIIGKTLVALVIVLFLCMSINPSVAIDNVKKTSNPISSGNTLYVGGYGEGNFTKIQDAINNASDGDTVFVYDDSSPYYENLIINKSISLIGEDKNNTIIDGDNKGNVVTITANNVNLTGFTIQNAPDYGIIVTSNNNRIYNNIISSIDRFVIALRTAYFNIVENNEIINYRYCGIVSDSYASFNTIKYNIITGDQSEKPDNGIIVCSNNFLEGNIISFIHHGISLDEIGNNIVRKNTLINNDLGISIGYSVRNLILRNNFMNNIEDANFAIHKLYNINIFLNNYWSRPLVFPKIIKGKLMLWRNEDWVTRDWIYFDLRPALIPNRIGV